MFDWYRKWRSKRRGDEIFMVQKLKEGGKYDDLIEPQLIYISKKDAQFLFWEFGPGTFRCITRNINTGQLRTVWRHKEPFL